MTNLDRITFEVLRSALINLVSEMGVRLTRVAFSPVIADGRDFSLAMLSRDGELICTGPMDLPAHLGTLEFTLKVVLEKFPVDEVREGDVFLLNEPHTGGTHNNDMRVVKPVFVEGELLFWLVACGHWPDVGGPEPGSFNALATSSFAEGIRVPPVRIYREGERLQDVIDVILGNVRLAAESGGDLQAMLAACSAGRERLLEICNKYGAETIVRASEEMMNYSERMLLAETRKLPNGVYEWTDWVDVDLPHPDKPAYSVTLRLEVQDGELTFDYRGSDPQPMGPTGSSLPMTWAGTVCGLINLFPSVHYNHGVVRHLRVLTTPGSCVDVQFPAAVCGTGAGVHEKVLACVLNCLGQADPSRKTAGIFNLLNVTAGGTRDDGRLWVMYLWPAGGFGGTTRGDAGLPTMMLFSTGSKNQPVEVLERANPVIFDLVALKKDSMGAGRYRGGPGEERVFRVTEGRATLTAVGDRNKFPIWGIDGGSPGGSQDIVVSEGEDGERWVGVSCAGERLIPGETVHLWTGGGGGLGDPLDRPPEEVLRDVSEELLSSQTAERDYGVRVTTVDEDVFLYEIDYPETLRIRAKRRASVNPSTSLETAPLRSTPRRS